MLRSIAVRLWATVLLATTLGGVVVPTFGDLHAGADLVCADEVWTDVGHHTRTQIEGVRPPAGDDHCAVCHLLRALNGAADDAKRYVILAAPVRPSFLAAIGLTHESAPDGLPSRAPPARA